MSVTFHVPGAPTTVEIVDCDNHSCDSDHWCLRCANGLNVEERSEAPDCNFANDNARDLLGFLGEFDSAADSDLTGYWRLDYLPIIRRAIMGRRSRAGRHQYKSRILTAEQVMNGDFTSGPMVLDCSDPDNDAKRMDRIDRLEAVVMYAQSHGLEVHWG